MRRTQTTCLCLGALMAAAAAPADVLERMDEALRFGTDDGGIRAQVNGTIDLEGYWFDQPPPGLIQADGHSLLTPRLTLFFDAQLGPRVYAFAQARWDEGFDPGDNNGGVRLDEWAVRFTPWDDGRLNLQAGQFATVFGNWTPRHGSWENPFVNAPLPYENLTGIWDSAAARSVGTLLRWSHVDPVVTGEAEAADKDLRLPVIWGPGYTTGVAVSGALGRFGYALEIKNAGLSSRPEAWDAGASRWKHPTVTGRASYRPNPMWDLGLSASTGSYLLESAAPTVAPGHDLEDYRQTTVGGDLAFAWHHLQVWAEVIAVRFAIPGVGPADTAACYLEARYKVTPQLAGAVRWGRQVYGTVDDADAGPVRWGRNAWRLDVAATWRLSYHAQAKLQYGVHHEELAAESLADLLAAQVTLRF